MRTGRPKQPLILTDEERERLESRSVVRGLILLAILVLLASMVRAGLGRVFVHGWWRP